VGLFDQIGKQLGGALGASGGRQPDILQIVQALMAQNGGLDGLLAKLQQGGLGELVKSWIGTGANLPVSAAQITQALGNPQLATVAKQFGVEPQQLAGLVSQHLPGLVDKLSPDGVLTGNTQDLLAQGASLLKGFLK
jgi:uncharacterized protein YidB (DUF937 family)